MVLWIGFDLQAEIEAGGENNSTALHYAAWFGKQAVAAQLLHAGASVSAVDNGGWTPLHWAAYYGKSSIANLLLQANARPTAVNNDGSTPAQLAKQRGRGDLEASRSLEVRADSAGHPIHFIRRETFLNPLCGAVHWF